MIAEHRHGLVSTFEAYEDLVGHPLCARSVTSQVAIERDNDD